MITLAEQDRTDRALIAEGTRLLNRAVGKGAVGEYQIQAAMVHGPTAGLALLDAVEEKPTGHYRLDVVRAHLLEMDGDTTAALHHYRAAADRTTNRPARQHP